MSADRLLDGVRAVEIGNAVAGSVAGKLLVDAGAEVTKIWCSTEDRTAFAMWDDHKRHVDGAAMVPPLDEADIVIDQQWVAGRDRISASLDRARSRRRSIYCSVRSGLGFPTDSLTAPDFESLVAAASGVFSSAVSGQPAAGIAYIDVPIASVAAGIHIATAAVAALTERPDGCTIDIALTDVAPFQKGVEFSRTEHLDAVRGTHLPASGVFRAGDGRWLQLDAPSTRLARRLRDALERDGFSLEGLDALALALNEVTADAAALALDALATLFASAPASEWEPRLNAAGVPCAICRTTDEWFGSDAARRCGAVVDDGGRRRVGPMVR